MPSGQRVLTILKKYKIYDQAARVKNIRADYILALYQMMKDIHDTLELCHIEYWVDGGTLLGAVRHEGIIPWDDDLDIQIHQRDLQSFLHKAVPALKNLGYGMKGMKVITLPSQFKTLSKELPPSCDVFVASEKNGRLNLPGWKHAIQIQHHKPLKLYKLGRFQVYGPRDPHPYLSDLYGTNYMQQAWRGWDHSTKTGEHSSCVPFVLEKKFRAPAEPQGPLHGNKDTLQVFLRGHCGANEKKCHPVKSRG